VFLYVHPEGEMVSVFPSIWRLYTAARSTSGQYPTAIGFPPRLLLATSWLRRVGTE
jgi:hypothetical protein